MSPKGTDKPNRQPSKAPTDDAEVAKTESVEEPSSFEDEPYVYSKSVDRYLRWKKRRENWLPIITTILSFMALIVIVGQAFIYDQQLRIARRQVGINLITERAYVGVANLKANFVKGEIVILLENTGRVPAKNIRVEAKEFRQTHKVVGSTTKFDAGHARLFPGTFKMRVIIAMNEFQPDEINAIQQKTESLVVAGRVQYEDGFGNDDVTVFAFEYNPPEAEDWIAMSQDFGEVEPSLQSRAYDVSQKDGVTIVSAITPEIRPDSGRRIFVPAPYQSWTPLSPSPPASGQRVVPTPYVTHTPLTIRRADRGPVMTPYGGPTPFAKATILTSQADRNQSSSCTCSCSWVCDNRCQFNCTNCSLTDQIASAERCCEAAHEAAGDIGPCPP